MDQGELTVSNLPGPSPNFAACRSERERRLGLVPNSPCWVTIVSTMAASPQMLFRADVKWLVQDCVMSVTASFLFNCIYLCTFVAWVRLLSFSQTFLSLLEASSVSPVASVAEGEGL